MSFTQFPVSGVLKVANSSALPAKADQGDVAVAQDTGTVYEFANGSWVQIASTTPVVAGASKSLNNLTSPTAINQALIPSTSLTLGTAANSWATGYITVLNDSSDVASVKANVRQLIDSSGVQSVVWDSRLMRDSSSNNVIDWNQRKLIGPNSGGTVASWDNGAHIKLEPGAASAGQAPLKFQTGTNLSTPEDGAMEFDGSHLYITISGVRHTIV